MTDNHLLQLSHLDTMLAQATGIDEITSVRALAAAAFEYAANIKMSREVCQSYAMARIRSERKCGQVLATLELHGSNQHGRKSGGATSLADLRITKDEAYRWKTIAKFSDEKFENLMLGRFQSNDDITTDFFYKAYRIESMRKRGINTDKPQPAPTHTPESIAKTAHEHLTPPGIARLIELLSKGE